MKSWQTHLIARATGENDLKHENGNTQDIMNVLLAADASAAAFTKKFAPTLKGRTLIETCRNVWEFVKTQIPYKIDTPGYQWIKSPGRLWADQQGDCKSFSLFIGSCLRNLGIPYGYRFTSYRQDDATPTHVYVYVPLKDGKEIILDAVWKGPFNSQKPFAHKKDVLMSKISYLGSADGHIAGTLIDLPKDYHDMSDAEFDLYLARQRAEIEKMNHAKIGSPYADRWDAAIAELNYAIGNIDNPDAIIARADAMIGKAKKAGKKTGAGKLLQKIGKGIKKVGKAVVKTVTAPVRLIAKGALEIYLPKAAPAFLYLFTPPGIKLPDLMARKKAKAERFKNFVVKGISMKESHFMGIIRNALTKRFGKSPESYLQERLGNRVSGIAGTKNKQRSPSVIKKTGPAITKGLPMSLPTSAPQVRQLQQKLNQAGANLKVDGQLGPKTEAAFKQAQANMFKNQLPGQATQVTKIEPPASDKILKKGFFRGAEGIVENAASGNLAGAILSAINWLISKITGAGKGEKPEPFTADDLPDLERDASNAFEWKDMQEDYSNLNAQQKAQVKVVATEFIEEAKEMPVLHDVAEKIAEKVKEKLPFLDDKQVKEVTGEITEGAEPLSEEDGRALGFSIKNQNPRGEVNMNNGGGTRGGICNC